MIPAAAFAQTGPKTTDSVTALKKVTVTATRTATDVRDVAAPVLVLDSAAIREKAPNGVADLLREQPGVDVVGTGVNQARPAIRGQRGQRVLLMEDGLRLNNSRRQQDFGEIPALVDPAQVSRVEVVRGPASVLYGTDAIGGVINVISRTPTFGAQSLSWRAGYLYGTAGSLGKTSLSVSGSSDRIAFDLFGTARVAGDYDAPAGAYGNVKLANNTTLQHSGVRDRNFGGSLSWRASDQFTAFAKVERYGADNSGFGYIPPTLIGGDPTQIEITYPNQEFTKFTAGLRAARLNTALADRFELAAYTQQNGRDLAQHIFAFFGPGTPPGAGVDIRTFNHTDVGTSGFRAEFSKLVSKAIVTYGADYFIDRSTNSDSSATTVVGFGPPSTSYANIAQVPNATLSSAGVFAQADIRLHERFSLIVGGRAQTTSSEPTATAGRTDPLTSHSNGTGVYAVNAVWRATDDLSLVGTVGTGFRSPNLVERYFNGPTPEGSAYEQATPDLKPESSVNVDGGFRYRAGAFAFDATAFQNDIHDAIVITPTGAKNNNLPVYQNVNIGHLRATGIEGTASWAMGQGFTLGANYTTLKSTNVTAADSPTGDSYASKLNLSLGWVAPNSRFWGEYVLRHNGDQKDIDPTASPVGTVLPAFTVHSVRAGIRGWTIGNVRQDVTVGVENIGNTLYAEAANASFFRPEPGRRLVIGLNTTY